MKSIINPNIYENTTLKQDIEFLLDSNKKISNNKIINILIKYFFAYKYNSSIDQKIQLADINELFSVWNQFFELLEFNQLESVSSTDVKFIATLHFFQENWYALSMLWDISSTVEIFKDIINRTIDKNIFGGNYVWLDLWTWSWILLLAQYIQANRNKFDSIENKWFDISSSVWFTKKIVEKLEIWEVIYGDTTMKSTYISNVKWELISHISNETIPMPWISMDTIADPFIENNIALFEWLDGKIIENTNFFPSAIKMIIDLWENKKKEIIWNPKNKFQIDFIRENFAKNKVLDFNLEEDRFLLESIFPKSIEINWKFTKLNKIWKKLIKIWKVNELSHWRNRWN